MRLIYKIEDWAIVVFQILIVLLFLSIMTALFLSAKDGQETENLIGTVVGKIAEHNEDFTRYVVAIKNNKYGIVSKSVKYEVYVQTNVGDKVCYSFNKAEIEHSLR